MDIDELLGKQIFHKNKASYYAKKVRILEAKEDQERLNKLIGKCFDLSPTKSYREYIMITSLDERLQPVGTKIEIFGRGKNKNMVISLRASFFAFYAERSKPISKARFNKYIADFQEFLK